MAFQSLNTFDLTKIFIALSLISFLNSQNTLPKKLLSPFPIPFLSLMFLLVKILVTYNFYI